MSLEIITKPSQNLLQRRSISASALFFILTFFFFFWLFCFGGGVVFFTNTEIRKSIRLILILVAIRQFPYTQTTDISKRSFEKNMTFFSKDNVKHFEVPGDDGKVDTSTLLEASRGVVEMVCKQFIEFLSGSVHTCALYSHISV